MVNDDMVIRKIAYKWRPKRRKRDRVGTNYADYSGLTPEEADATDPELEELFKNSKRRAKRRVRKMIAD